MKKFEKPEFKVTMKKGEFQDTLKLCSVNCVKA